MEEFKQANEIAERIIDETDIKYIAHQCIKELDVAVTEELTNYITEDLSPYQIEKIIDQVYKQVLSDLGKELFMFIRYTVPEYKTFFYNKLTSKNVTTEI